MSKSRVKNVQQQDPPTSTGPQPASASNQEASENVESTGLQNYEQTLGSWLGPKLYEAVSDALTEEAFEGYTKDAIDALFETLAEQADKLDGTANTSQIEGFVDALQERLGPLAEQWLAEEGLPLRQSLRNWVDANPVMVVITALLAAAGAVLADLDIPTLEKEFDLGKGFTGSLSADLGSLRNIALEQVKASLEYASGPLMAAINVNVEGDDVSGDASVRYEGDRWSGGLAANVDKDGVVGGSADVGYSHDGLSANGRATFADSKFSGYSLNATRESGKLTDRFALSGTGDGGWDGSLGRTYTGDRWSAGLSADAANDRRLGGTASLGYSHDGLSADARASFTDGDFSGYALNANRQDGKFSERFSLSGNGDGDWSATHGRSYTGDRWSGSLQNGIGPDGAWNTSASTAYQGDRLSAGLKGTLDHTGAATGEGSLGYNREDLSLSALGRFDQDGLDSYQFDSSIGPDNRQLGFGLSGTGAGDWKASASGSYSTEDVK
ncbi:MAG: hypothetical protein KTR31_02565, partial [Myxococcales bacterium]|nr:hypothetical protein [Myxococcales bacterium]